MSSKDDSTEQLLGSGNYSIPEVKINTATSTSSLYTDNSSSSHNTNSVATASTSTTCSLVSSAGVNTSSMSSGAKQVLSLSEGVVEKEVQAEVLKTTSVTHGFGIPTRPGNLSGNNSRSSSSNNSSMNGGNSSMNGGNSSMKGSSMNGPTLRSSAVEQYDGVCDRGAKITVLMEARYCARHRDDAYATPLMVSGGRVRVGFRWEGGGR